MRRKKKAVEILGEAHRDTSAAAPVVPVAVAARGLKRKPPPPYLGAQLYLQQVPPPRPVTSGNLTFGGHDLAFLARVITVPREAEFCRFCHSLSAVSNTVLRLPPLGVRRMQGLRQLTFLARTFGMPVVWPFCGEEDDPESIADVCNMVAFEVVPTPELAETFNKLVDVAFLPLRVSDGGGEVLHVARLLEMAGRCRVVLCLHCGTEGGVGRELGVLASLRRLSDYPIIADCVPPHVGETALSSVAGGVDGVALDLHWAAAPDGKGSLVIEEFDNLRRRMGTLRETLIELAVESERRRVL